MQKLRYAQAVYGLLLLLYVVLFEYNFTNPGFVDNSPWSFILLIAVLVIAQSIFDIVKNGKRASAENALPVWLKVLTAIHFICSGGLLIILIVSDFSTTALTRNYIILLYLTGLPLSIVIKSHLRPSRKRKLFI